MNDSLQTASNDKTAGKVWWIDWFRKYRIEVLLFLLLWGTYGYFYQSTGTNEAVRFDQIRALVHDHTLAIDRYCFNSPDLIRYPKDTGLIYPNKAPGMTFIGALPFAVLSPILSTFQAAGLPEWIYWHLLTYLTTVFTVSLLSALAAVAVYRILRKLTGNSDFSIQIVIAIWIGTLLFPFSTLFYSHAAAGSLLTIGFYLLFKQRYRGAAAVGGQLVLPVTAGAVIGFSVVVEYPTALLGAVLSVYTLWLTWRSKGSTRNKVIMLAAFLSGLGVGGALLLIYNAAAFGNIFYIPYESYSTPGSAFYSSYSEGWMGLHWSGLGPFLHALATVTIYRPLGLLYVVVERWHVYACNPVLWLTIPGLIVMLWTHKVRPEGLMVTAMVVIYLLFIGNYGSTVYEWGGGLYLGPRHLIPLLPFLALPLYFGAAKLRFAFYPLAAVSIFYMLLATSVEPRIAFPFGDIARDFLFPDYLRGQLAQNTASLFDTEHRNLTNDSTAANLAKLVQMPGRYQLVPLMLWWMIAGATFLFWLTPKRDRRWRNATIALGLFVAAIALTPAIHHAVTFPSVGEHGLLAKYYRNAKWEGAPVEIQIDPAVDFDWSKEAPYPPPFSVEWTGNIIIERTGHYQLSLVADDGALLQVDNNLVVDATTPPLQEKGQTVFLTKGLHLVRVRYFNSSAGGSVKLFWTLVGRPRQIVPSEVLSPTVTRRSPSGS